MTSTYSAEARHSKPNGHISRGDRARFLFERGHVKPKGGNTHYEVNSEALNSTTVYRVEFASNGTVFCSCPDWQRAYLRTGKMDTWCKHSQAVALYRKACRDGSRKH